MTGYFIKLRAHEYRVAVDIVTYRDGSQLRVVFCNGRVIRNELDMDSLPKTVQYALRRELDAR